MYQRNRYRMHLFLGITLPALLVGFGWYTVFAQSQNLEALTIKTHQAAELEVVRNVARAADAYISHELEQRPEAVQKIEQEVLERFVEPLRLGRTGNTWFCGSQAVMFDHSKNFVTEYWGKNAADLFATQQKGTWHDREMIEIVMQGREGTGWYFWQPGAQESAPWWEFLTHDAGREIAAWTTIEGSAKSHGKINWVIGISATLPELMQMNGVYAQVQRSIALMSCITVAVFALLVLLQQRRASLKIREASYRAIVEAQTELICRFRRDGTLTFVNQAYARSFGTVPHALIGLNVFDLIADEERSAAIAQLTRLNRDNPVIVREQLIKTDPHQCRWQQWTDRAILNQWGQVIEVQSIGYDITDRKVYEAKIEHLAFTDSLTGLANRRRLYDIGSAALSANHKTFACVALIYLDLDRFKPINDTLGHDAGDELLVQVAARLQSCVRQEDILARLGGDEFAILLHPSNLEKAKAVADRILTALNQSFHLREHVIHLEASLGIAIATQPAMPFNQLLNQADMAMYRAKAEGRGSYAVFDAKMGAEASVRLKLETDLHQVIDRQELRVYYQPIVALSSGDTVGFEALVRWQHPKRGLLAPVDFLPLARESGLTLAIERWMLQEACRQMAFWQTYRPTTLLSINVNISGKHLAQPDLVEQLDRLLQETGLNPSSLCLEVAEESVIQHPELAIAKLTHLRSLGVQISLDQFGTGYSSLSYLHRFPVDVLKIDRSFVCELGRDSPNGEIVRTLVLLSHSLGIRPVAEGVETVDQLTLLKSWHCHYGQGCFFSEPLDKLTAKALVATYQGNKKDQLLSSSC